MIKARQPQMTTMKHHIPKFSLQLVRLLIVGGFLLTGFKTDKPHALTWSDILVHSQTWHTQSTQATLLKVLGTPYKQMPTVSLPDEYIMYFHVPNQPERMYWIMLDTQTRRYLYWSGQSQKKPR